MTKEPTWRPISPDEAHVIREIVSAAGIRQGDRLVDDLDGAWVSNSTEWILDIKASKSDAGCELPDGPFPARAFVPSRSAYRGEVIIWVSKGHLSGLEYAWITDDPPTRWPRADEMKVSPQTGG